MEAHLHAVKVVAFMETWNKLTARDPRPETRNPEPDSDMEFGVK